MTTQAQGAADVRPTKRRRRGPKRAIDATRTWDVAAWLEEELGVGFHLWRSRGMGWVLREMQDGTDHHGRQVMRYVEVDSAPEGQLGALLLRHQQRERKAPPSDKR